MAGKTYYVSGTGNDKNDGLKEGAAFRTLQKAGDLVKAGDTVYVMNGTYTNIYPNILDISDKHGTAKAPITFTAYPGHTPVLEAHKNNWNAVSITGSSYIVVNGLTMTGARDETTLKYALQEKNNLGNPATSGNGINVTYIDGDEKQHSHHITISNNNISKFPGGGIGTTQADYITVEKNVVSGNGWYSPFGVQGITMLNLWNSDNNVKDYKVIIRGNTSFDNNQLVPSDATGRIQEGHGIMLDRSYIGTDFYEGKALIANNLIYNNGGGGIQIFKGQNPVDIVNNTIYKNSQNLLLGEIFINSSKNVQASNNIMYAKSGASANYIANSSNVSFDNNIAYNGAFKDTGSGNVLKDPLFVNAANHDFRLKSGSPAIDAGSNAFNKSTKNTPIDGDGNGSVLIDAGAYEAATNKTAIANQISLLNGTDSSESLKGNDQANKIYGFGGQDTIVGNLGNDQLFGGDGNDTLFGGIGDDQLLGGAGNDLLYGGNGKDVLTGGYGADTFVLALGEGTDSITDFEIGKDKLALSGGLKFGQLSIQQQGSIALIMDSSDNQVLARLDNVTASILSAQPSTFITI